MTLAISELTCVPAVFRTFASGFQRSDNSEKNGTQAQGVHAYIYSDSQTIRATLTHLARPNLSYPSHYGTKLEAVTAVDLALRLRSNPAPSMDLSGPPHGL